MCCTRGVRGSQLLISCGTFRNAMMAAAKWFSARKLLSSFSSRPSSSGKRLNQPWATSTTERRRRLLGSPRNSLASGQRPLTGDVTMALHRGQSRGADMARVGTEVFVATPARLRADGIKPPTSTPPVVSHHAGWLWSRCMTRVSGPGVHRTRGPRGGSRSMTKRQLNVISGCSGVRLLRLTAPDRRAPPVKFLKPPVA